MSDNNEELFQRLIKSIQEENEKQTAILKSEFRSEISEIKAELSQIKAVTKKESNKLIELEEKTKILENKYLQTERTLKKNNIIIFGLEEVQTNLVAFAIQQLNTHLELDLKVSDINNIYPTGKSQNNRPIVIQFVSFLSKLAVLKQCKKLKGTKISISEDRIKEGRDIRKRLLKYQTEARKKNFRSYIKGNKLIINNDIFSLEDLEIAENDTEEIDEDSDYLEIETNPDREENIQEKTTEGLEATNIAKKEKHTKKKTETNLNHVRPITRRLVKDKIGSEKDTKKNLRHASTSEIK